VYAFSNAFLPSSTTECDPAGAETRRFIVSRSTATPSLEGERESIAANAWRSLNEAASNNEVIVTTHLHGSITHTQLRVSQAAISARPESNQGLHANFSKCGGMVGRTTAEAIGGRYCREDLGVFRNQASGTCSSAKTDRWCLEVRVKWLL
jgi:hypothetical protein